MGMERHEYWVLGFFQKPPPPFSFSIEPSGAWHSVIPSHLHEHGNLCTWIAPDWCTAVTMHPSCGDRRPPNTYFLKQAPCIKRVPDVSIPEGPPQIPWMTILTLVGETQHVVGNLRERSVLSQRGPMVSEDQLWIFDPKKAKEHWWKQLGLNLITPVAFSWGLYAKSTAAEVSRAGAQRWAEVIYMAWIKSFAEDTRAMHSKAILPLAGLCLHQSAASEAVFLSRGNPKMGGLQFPEFWELKSIFNLPWLRNTAPRLHLPAQPVTVGTTIAKAGSKTFCRSTKSVMQN